MRHEQQLDAQNSESKQQADAGLIPSISLPKGGGAISGIGEKFGANPVTGTGAMSVPIATSPSRFGPALSLSYDSGAGNGPFGLGWTLSAPAISRKTDKGLPQYRDADESDVLILSAAEDLVPTLMQQNEDVKSWPMAPVHWRRVNARYRGVAAAAASTAASDCGLNRSTQHRPSL